MKLLARVAPVVVVGLAFALARSPASPAYTVQTAGSAHPHASLIRSAESLGYQIPAYKFQGASSCASMGCHNAGHKQKKGSEFSTWAGYDPHQNAYNVLFNADSKRIVRLLRGLPASDEANVLAHREAVCLKCHTTDVPKEWHDPAPLQVEAADAVACESCHGASERYKAVHYLDEWKTLDRKQKAEQYGFYPTDDLAFRVRMCGSCHIGQEGWDVNHQLIAAGHPALRFEYTSQHFSPKYTRHWVEESYGPDFDARAWEIGQLASAKCAIELLISRTKQDWPELAEYNCFSCHHDLQSKAWQGALPDKQPGSLRWGTWYYPLLNRAAGELPAFDELTLRMRKVGTPNAKLQSTASAALKQIDARLRDLQSIADRDSRIQPYTAERLRTQLLGLTALPAPATWDEASQRYLAAASLYHSLTEIQPGLKDARLREGFTNLADLLKFPTGANSPAVDRFTPERFRATFLLLQQRLSP